MDRPYIVFLDAETIGEVQEMQVLRELCNLTSYQSTPHSLRITRIAGNEIVITNKVLIDSEVIDACPAMKLVCIAATGMNNVDLPYAKSKGISVKNVAGYSTESVVQHTFALMFALNNKLEYYTNYTRSGLYSKSHLFTHYGPAFNEIHGKTLGIIGLGTIGKRVAAVAEVFGMDIIYYSTSGKNTGNIYRNVPLEELLEKSDIISIHCPLNDETRNLINDSHLGMMKKSAVLINTGRGGIVNEAALARALDIGTISGAALDVLEKEPPDPQNPLFRIKSPEKLIITPHLAWATIEARTRLVQGLIRNIKEYLSTSKNV